MIKLLNVHGAAEYLSIPKSSLYKMTMNRDIPFVKIGKAVRFDVGDLDQWIKEKRIGL